jgi:hypothetical protein
MSVGKKLAELIRDRSLDGDTRVRMPASEYWIFSAKDKFKYIFFN